MAIAYIGIGSNLGDRLRNLRDALDRLFGVAAIAPDGADAVAAVYETSPVGMAASDPPFLNTAARVRCELPALQLLDHLLAVEAALGRRRDRNCGSRTIDLDLLLFDGLLLQKPGLTVPHPRLHERRFVLEPLADIAPRAHHPDLGKTIQELALQARADHTAQTVALLHGRTWYGGSEPTPRARRIEPNDGNQFSAPGPVGGMAAS